MNSGSNTPRVEFNCHSKYLNRRVTLQRVASQQLIDVTPSFDNSAYLIIVPVPEGHDDSSKSLEQGGDHEFILLA